MDGGQAIQQTITTTTNTESTLPNDESIVHASDNCSDYSLPLLGVNRVVMQKMQQQQLLLLLMMNVIIVMYRQQQQEQQQQQLSKSVSPVKN